MSMSMHVHGYRSADVTWRGMKAIWDACVAANVAVPEAVETFFGGEPPGDKPGIDVNIDAAVRDWGDEARQGFEIDVQKLPLNVRFIRVYCAY